MPVSSEKFPPKSALTLRTFSIRYIKTVAVLGVFLVAFGGAYLAMNHKRIFPADDEIVIYGRDSCAITTGMREFLAERNIAYTYGDIDKPLLSQELAAQLKLTSARPVKLPVILVAGRVIERPEKEVVIRLRDEAISKKPDR